MANQEIIYGLVGVGGLLIVAAVTNSGLGQTIQGHANKVSTTPLGSGTTSGSGIVGSAGSAIASAAGNVISKVNGKNVPTLPQETALKGPAAVSWATAILSSLGAPANQANVNSLIDWFNHEGGGGANNPLNTTLSTSGVTGSINSVGVKSYSTPAAGIAATVQTLQGGYPNIVAALQGGLGLTNAGANVAAELHKWSGGGYSSL